MAETSSNASAHVSRLHSRRAALAAAHQAMIDAIAADVAAHYAQERVVPASDYPVASPDGPPT